MFAQRGIATRRYICGAVQTDLNVSHDFAPDFNYPSRAGYQIAATRPRGFPSSSEKMRRARARSWITKFRDSFIGNMQHRAGVLTELYIRRQ